MADPSDNLSDESLVEDEGDDLDQDEVSSHGVMYEVSSNVTEKTECETSSPDKLSFSQVPAAQPVVVPPPVRNPLLAGPPVKPRNPLLRDRASVDSDSRHVHRNLYPFAVNLV